MPKKQLIVNGHRCKGEAREHKVNTVVRGRIRERRMRYYKIMSYIVPISAVWGESESSLIEVIDDGKPIICYIGATTKDGKAVNLIQLRGDVYEEKL